MSRRDQSGSRSGTLQARQVLADEPVRILKRYGASTPASAAAPGTELQHE